jgi:hypothetical protein
MCAPGRGRAGELLPFFFNSPFLRCRQQRRRLLRCNSGRRRRRRLISTAACRLLRRSPLSGALPPPPHLGSPPSLPALLPAPSPPRLGRGRAPRCCSLPHSSLLPWDRPLPLPPPPPSGPGPPCAAFAPLVSRELPPPPPLPRPYRGPCSAGTRPSSGAQLEECKRHRTPRGGSLGGGGEVVGTPAPALTRHTFHFHLSHFSCVRYNLSTSAEHGLDYLVYCALDRSDVADGASFLVGGHYTLHSSACFMLPESCRTQSTTRCAHATFSARSRCKTAAAADAAAALLRSTARLGPVRR